MAKGEKWKEVPEFLGMLASSHGRVLLPTYHYPSGLGGYRTARTKPTVGAISRASKGAAHSYRAIYNRKLGNLKVHQLVCAAFHGPKPFEGAVVIHIDENAHNNKPENLKWGTQKENLNAPGFIEYCKSRVGNNSPTVKGRANAEPLQL